MFCDLKILCESVVHTVRLSLWVILLPPAPLCCGDTDPARREKRVRSVGKGKRPHQAWSYLDALGDPGSQHWATVGGLMMSDQLTGWTARQRLGLRKNEQS